MTKPVCQYCNINEAVYVVFIKKPIEHNDVASFAYNYANNSGNLESTQFKTVEETVVCEDCYRKGISLRDFKQEEIDSKKPVVYINPDMYSISPFRSM
jgi:hypothetical protein